MPWVAQSQTAHTRTMGPSFSDDGKFYAQKEFGYFAKPQSIEIHEDEYPQAKQDQNASSVSNRVAGGFNPPPALTPPHKLA